MKIFITGIDTDSGKSVVTGLIAKYLMHNKQSTITQKYVQTGCVNIADDIITHRQIMNIELLQEDLQQITCSYLFKHPASPHLSAQMEDVRIDSQLFTNATRILEQNYKYILMEGAGGLMVPLNFNTLLIDYIENKNYPIILVSSSKLGSINHTILSLEVLKKRNMNLIGIVYNQYPNLDNTITLDSEKMIKKYMKQYFPNAGFVNIPKINIEKAPIIDFSDIIEI